MSCSKTFGLVSLPQTRGKMTVLRTNYTISGPQHGLFKATHLPNGNHPVQVPYYGFMENVSVSEPHAFDKAYASRLCGGCREER